MHYLIYKITNKLNNKIYVGKHKTDNKDDSYFGSGSLLKRAVGKYGIENFTKEILFECKTEDEMNQKEADIVDEEFIARDDTYNVKLGGQGGFDYINRTGKNVSDRNNIWTDERRNRTASGVSAYYKNLSGEEKDEWKQKISNSVQLHRNLFGGTFQGRHHSEETKQKMREAKIGRISGRNNPQYGKHWITNGTENMLVKKSIPLPDGWRKGRV